MCNQRERLIGYVYDECDAGERAEMQQHLESCGECRAEIAALREVRADLQAWEVPDYESVWRPFTPAPAAAWWSQVPRWAMAAAAGLVLMAGAGGGAVSYVLLDGARVSAAPSQVAADAVSRDDIRQLEREIDKRIKAEVAQLNERVVLASSRPLPPEMAVSLHNEFEKQLTELRAMNDKQRDVINGIYNNLGQLRLSFDAQHSLLKGTVNNLVSLVDQKQGR